MSSVKFTADHEWLRLEDDGSVMVGITDYAQEQLGDIVYIELPNVGDVLVVGSETVVIESVKTAGEIKAPIGGEVLEVNGALADKPEVINFDPANGGWLFRMAPDDVDELDQFMDEDVYQEFVKEL